MSLELTGASHLSPLKVQLAGPSEQSSNPLVVLAGPTAVGKTEVAVRLCGRLGREAEIVSADSRQIYRLMEIGTAKPTPAERRAPHHLLDIRDPDERYSAGQFSVDAWMAVRAIRERAAIPVVVGGTGLYIEAMLDGLDPIPAAAAQEVRNQIRERLRNEGLRALYGDLAGKDPVRARQISPADATRITRSLERYLLGAGLTGNWQRYRERKPPMPLVYCCLTRDRASLYRRIDRRAERMVAHGLVEEAEQLRRMGYPDGCPGLRTLGYAEAVAYLNSELNRGELVSAIQRRTRNYAKRQLTWFGRDRRIRWIDLDVHGSQGAAALVRAQLEAEAAVARKPTFSY